MKKSIFLLGTLMVFSSCEERPEKLENVRGIPGPDEVKAIRMSLDEQEEELKNRGYQTFQYKDADSTYLMQQYYMVFLKRGPNRGQDSTEAAELQKKHMAHLTRMAEEGYASLAGPLGDDGEIRGIVIYNTATQREADSLSRLDPMVQAGRLEVEVHPWWVSKGGKLR